MSDEERRAALLFYRKHPHALPQTPRSRIALLQNVAHDPIRQSKRVRRELLASARKIRRNLEPLP